MPDITTIKSNVGLMIDGGASEREIATYLGSEGVTVQDLQARRMTADDEAAYIALARDPNSTAADLQAFVAERGFAVADEDAQAFVANRAREPQVAASVLYGEAPDAPISPSPTAPANTLWGNVVGTAGEVADGLLPGSAEALAGAGGAARNLLDSVVLGNAPYDPSGAFAAASGAQGRDQARLEEENPTLASAAGWAGFGSSFALPAARLAKGATVGAGIVNGSINGAGYGALSGVLNDSGDGRLANAGRGALFGLGVGGAAAPIARKVEGVLSTARRNVPGVNGVLTSLENLPRRARGLPLAPPSAAASAQAERIINRDLRGTVIETGMGRGTVPATPDTIASEVGRRAALDVPAMPADLNEPLRSTVAWALQGRGPMSTRARQELSARQAQSGPRARQHIAAELGPIVDPIAEVETIRRRASAASAPGYNAAYAQPMVVTDDIAAIMGTPAFRDALPQAVKNIRNDLGDPQALGFRMGPDGGVEGMNTLSTEGFDQVIRAMREAGRQAGEVNPITGAVRQTTNSVKINDRTRDLQGALSSQNAAYRDATANYADEMALTDALRRGGDVAKLSGPEIDAQRRAMPALAQEGWAAGARTALADAATQASLRPAANVAQAVRQPLGLSGAGMSSGVGDQAKVQAIETMSGKPGVLSRIDDRMEAEDQAWRTFAAARSAGRLGDSPDAITGLLGTGVAVGRKLAQGRPLAALSDMVLRGNPRGTLSYRTDVQDRAAELLTAGSPQAVQAAMGALSSRTLTDRAKRVAIDRGAGNVAKVSALQAAGQSTDPLPLEDLEAPAFLSPVDRAPLYR